jgi:geranylgeranyl diphosphate synthase type I
MDFESRPEIDVEDYLRMIDAKTAQLFSCAVVLGALVGGAKEEQIEQLSAFGRQLGLAFQVQDDLLGIWEKQKTTGKSACTDIREKKKTLPVIYALKNATGNEKIRLSGLYQSRKRRLTSAEVAEVVGILDNVGARRHTEEFKQRYQKRALEQLSKMDIPQPRAAELREMADFILSQG